MPRYWVSFDLGLRGNYEELYAWLDSQGAKECGDGVASFVSNKSREQIISELKKLEQPPIKSLPGSRTTARIYLITMKEGGKFIVGKRRAAPWTGYAPTEQESEIEA